MANKKLGSATPAAATNTTLYTVPAMKSAVFNLNVCNTTAAAVSVRVSVGGDSIEYDASIPANGVLERTALIAEAGEVVSVRASATGVVFRAYGIEE